MTRVRSLWFVLLMALAGIASAQTTMAPHPRLLLDPPTLTALRARMAANTPQWQLLKTYCDSFIGGTVNLPDGDGYPDPPNIGQGYQGSNYWSAVLAEGLCYETLVASNPAAAAPYGAKAREVLMAMATTYSTAPGNHGQDPCTDDGYGTRFFGVGMGIGYDWVYPVLSDSDRQTIYTTANTWLASFSNPNGCSGFEYAHPQSNYFAGYFHADVAIALATYDENPNAAALWTDWQTNQFATAASNPPHIGVQPYYATHLVGGGWPEGFGNYGPLGTLNMSLPMIEVKTATGTDLIHAAAPYSFPIDAANYLMHFTWPSRKYIDDRDTNHATGNTTPPVGTADAGMFMQVLGTLRYWNAPQADVFQSYTNTVNAATSGNDGNEPWEQFLYWDPNGKSQSFATLPLSYFATGLNAVAARSDWTSSASWMSFRAAPYINNPGQGEEGFDQGSLALVRGANPLLVNGTGKIVHEPHGADDENRIYNDNYGNNDGSVYSSNRVLYNVFYARRMNGAKVVYRYGQAAYTAEDDGAQTRVAAYEDGTKYVYVLADKLENMYRPSDNGYAQVKSWSREIVYVRPNQFVVFDRTTDGSALDDQFLAFHFSSQPVAGSAPSGGKRLDVTYPNGYYAGAMTTVLPASATTTSIGMYPSNDGVSASAPVKVWQVQVRAPNSNPVQQWLTVFDMSSTAPQVAVASRINVTTGAATGAFLNGRTGNSAILVSTGNVSATIAGSVAYTIPVTTVATTSVITQLPANKAYTVTATTQGSNYQISVVPGGTIKTSAKGVLLFEVSASGVVSAG